jgi:hypothetical protein
MKHDVSLITSIEGLIAKLESVAEPAARTAVQLLQSVMSLHRIGLGEDTAASGADKYHWPFFRKSGQGASGQWPSYYCTGSIL